MPPRLTPNHAFERTRRSAQFFLGGRRWRRAAQLERWASRQCLVRFDAARSSRELDALAFVRDMRKILSSLTQGRGNRAGST
jgi:hypothetical protein